MSDISGESYNDLYVPGDSENSETSDSELSSDGDEVFDDDEQIECEGWKFISDIFDHKRPNAIPPLNDAREGVNDAVSLDRFTSPGSVFSYFFNDEVMSTICSCKRLSPKVTYTPLRG